MSCSKPGRDTYYIDGKFSPFFFTASRGLVTTSIRLWLLPFKSFPAYQLKNHPTIDTIQVVTKIYGKTSGLGPSYQKDGSLVYEHGPCGVISEHCGSNTHHDKTFREAIFFITNLYLQAKHLLHIGSKKYYRLTDSRIRPKITGVLLIVSQPAIMHSPRHSVLNNRDDYTIAGLINLQCGAGNFSKIWSACRQHEI